MQNESFLDYSKGKGDRYYYDLLKPLASLETLQAEDLLIGDSRKNSPPLLVLVNVPV